MPADAPLAMPFSRPVNVENPGEAPLHFKLEADETQRRAVASLLELIALDRLVARLSVQRWRKRGIRIEGQLSADVVQQCVVSLQPVPAHIEAPIVARFLPEAEVLAAEAEQSLEAYLNDPDDPPEPFDGKWVDIGGLVVEFLSLALDPYPRAPGAALSRQ